MIINPTVFGLLKKSTLSEIEEELEEHKYFSRTLSNDNRQSLIDNKQIKPKQGRLYVMVKYSKILKRAYFKHKIRLNIPHFRRVVARMIKLRKFKPKKKSLKQLID